MRMLLLLAVLMSASSLFIVPFNTFAHGTEHHGGHVDEQMKKLHAIMPMFSIASAELELAIEKGDAVAAKAHADKILAAVPDLKKSKPHKNVKQLKKFVEIATSFDEAITSTVDLIKKNELSGAKASFKKVEELCAACHAKFRD